MERLAKAEARCDCTYNGNQRIVYSNLSYRITTEQFVVESKSNSRDGDKQNQADNAKHIDIRKCTAKGKSWDDKQQPSDGETIASSYEDI